MKITARSLISTTMLLCSPTAVWGGQEKLASDLRRDNAQGNLDVIVRYKASPTDRHHQKIAKRGGVLKHEMDLIRSGHYSVPVHPSSSPAQLFRNTVRNRTSESVENVQVEKQNIPPSH